MPELFDLDQPLQPRKRTVLVPAGPVPDGRLAAARRQREAREAVERLRRVNENEKQRTQTPSAPIPSAPVPQPYPLEEHPELAAAAGRLQPEPPSGWPQLAKTIVPTGIQAGAGMGRALVEPVTRTVPPLGRALFGPEPEFYRPPGAEFEVGRGGMVRPTGPLPPWQKAMEMASVALPATAEGAVAVNVIGPAFAKAGVRQVARVGESVGRELAESYRAAPEAGFARIPGGKAAKPPSPIAADPYVPRGWPETYDEMLAIANENQARQEAEWAQKEAEWAQKAMVKRKSQKPPSPIAVSDAAARGHLAQKAGIPLTPEEQMAIAAKPREVAQPLPQAPSAPAPRETMGAGTARLPRDLAGQKSRYNIGMKSWTPKFESDVDAALYIITQATPSKRNTDYLIWLRGQFPEASDQALVAAGRRVRQGIKDQVAGQPEGVVSIPPMGIRPSGIMPPSPVAAEAPKPIKVTWKIRGQEVEAETYEEALQKLGHKPPPLQEGAGAAPPVEPPVGQAVGAPPRGPRIPKPPFMEGPFPEPGGVKPPAEPPKPPTAAGAPTSPVPPQKGKEGVAGNIRLSKYRESARPELQAWADAHPGEIQAARRGVRSDAQVQADAEKLLADVGFYRKRARWKPGQAFNAEEIAASRGLLQDASDKLAAARAAYHAADSTANLLTLQVAMTEHDFAQKVVTGVSAESGRSLRQFRKEVFDATSANDLQKMEEILKRLGDKAKLKEVAEALGKLDLNDPVAVATFIRSVNKPKAADVVFWLFLNSILSGGKSTIINFAGNAASLGAVMPEHVLGAVVEQGLARVQGRRVERFFQEVPAEVFGSVMGVQEAAKAGLHTLKHGMSALEVAKWEFREPIGGKLGAVLGMPLRSLGAGDAYFRVLAQRGGLNGLIVRKARIEGLTGDALLSRIAELRANPTAELLKEAEDFATYRLFQNDPGRVANWLIEGRRYIPGARFVVPFIKITANLIKFGFERSPLGILGPKVYRHIAQKSPEASDDIARIILGSLIAGSLALSFGNGRITGAGPTNPAERDRFYREGKQPYALRIGDRWVQYQRMEPLNQPITQVAAVIDAVNTKDKTADEKAWQAARTIAMNLASQPYLIAVSDFLNWLTNPQGETSTAFLQRQATGMVPYSAAQRTMAQMIDTTVRKPENIVERIEAQTPWLSRRTPARVNVFGEQVQRQTPPWSPIITSPAKESAIDTELGRLQMDIGFVGKTINGVELSPQLHRVYQKVAGKVAKREIAALLEHPGYGDLSDEEKEREIRKAVDMARDDVRGLMMRTFPELQQQAVAP